MNKKERKDFWNRFFKGKYTLVQTHKEYGVKILTCGISESEARQRGEDDIGIKSYEIRKTNKEDFESTLKRHGHK
jgi:hypothetical protein